MFAGITGATAIVSFLIGGDYGFAAVTAAFIGDRRHRHDRGRRERACPPASPKPGVAEKDEVVSLLLREFEENEADWLWQIDTNRRVRSASPRFAYALGRDPGAIDGTPFIQLVAGDAWESGQFPPSLHDLAERLKRRESFSNLLVQVTGRFRPPLVGAVGHADARRRRQLPRLPRGRVGRHRAARKPTRRSPTSRATTR